MTWALHIGGGILISALSFVVCWKLIQLSRPTHMLIIRGPVGTASQLTSGGLLDAEPLYRGKMLGQSAAGSPAVQDTRSLDIGYSAILYGPAGVDSVYGLHPITQGMNGISTLHSGEGLNSV